MNVASEKERIAFLLRQAGIEINCLRHANKQLAAQVFVVEAFHAALLGAPKSDGMSPDIGWKLEQKAQDLMKQAEEEKSRPAEPPYPFEAQTHEDTPQFLRDHHRITTELEELRALVRSVGIDRASLVEILSSFGARCLASDDQHPSKQPLQAADYGKFRADLLEWKARQSVGEQAHPAD